MLLSRDLLIVEVAFLMAFLVSDFFLGKNYNQLLKDLGFTDQCLAFSL